MVATPSITAQIIERLHHEPLIFISATLDEYWTVLNELGDESTPLTYDVEYINGEIRAQIGMTSDNHELIVTNIAALLRSAYYQQPNVRVMGSNKLVYIPSCELAVKPDVLVMHEESQLFPRKGQEAGILNPYLLAEVHSDSTYREDMYLKLRCYKQSASVQHIIYIEQEIPFVTVFTKQQDSRHWLSEDYNALDMAVQLDDSTIPMRDIYHKVAFNRAANA